MKLEVKNIGNKYAMLRVIANKHYCTFSELANDTIIITKHADLTDSEFGLVASDLVMEGFQVSLADKVKYLKWELEYYKENLKIFSDSESGPEVPMCYIEHATDNIKRIEDKLKQLKVNNA